MSALWLLPLAAAVAGALPVIVLVSRLREELRAVGRQLTRVAELRPALVEVRTAGQALRAALEARSRA